MIKKIFMIKKYQSYVKVKLKMANITI